MNPSDIIQDPHRRRIDAEELRALGLRLERAGWYWLKPLVVRTGVGLVLLAGEKRFAAKVRNGAITSIEVHAVREWAGVSAWLTLDAQTPNRTPMTVVEAARFATKIRRYVRLGKGDPVDDVVAEANGLHRENLRQTRYLITSVESWDEGTQERLYGDELLADVEAGKFGGSAGSDRFLRFKEQQKARLNPVDPRAQRRTLTNAVTTLHGIGDALTNLGHLSPELGDDELDAWERELYTFGTLLIQTRKLIKQRRETP